MDVFYDMSSIDKTKTTTGASGSILRGDETPQKDVKFAIGESRSEHPVSSPAKTTVGTAAAAVSPDRVKSRPNEQVQRPRKRVRHHAIHDYPLSLDQRKYLDKIKLKGGSYAILMALYCSATSSLRTPELRDGKLSQAFCDSSLAVGKDCQGAIREQYSGSWNGAIDTLEKKHKLVERHRHGSRGHEFSLTEAGKAFVEKLLREQDNQVAKEVLLQCKSKDSVSSLLDLDTVQMILDMDNVSRSTITKGKGGNDSKKQRSMESFFSKK